MSGQVAWYHGCTTFWWGSSRGSELRRRRPAQPKVTFDRCSRQIRGQLHWQKGLAVPRILFNPYALTFQIRTAIYSDRFYLPLVIKHVACLPGCLHLQLQTATATATATAAASAAGHSFGFQKPLLLSLKEHQNSLITVITVSKTGR